MLLHAMRIALKVAPQHSTQYADMTARLAEPELRAALPGARDLEHVGLGGHAYLLATVDEAALATLARLGATSEAFEWFDELGGVGGPLLRPLERPLDPFLPLEMAEARRYKGKTSEVFSHVLLNVALFAGAFRDRLETRLRILDPLAGGGTTLFLALALGYDAFGIELVRRHVETTAGFVKEYCRELRIPCRETRDRKPTRRHRYELGRREDPRTLVLVAGDTRRADELLRDVPGGARVHAVVGDLPYGIQHAGEARALLEEALPAWERVLLAGGTLALAWNATRLPRRVVVDAIASASSLEVRDEAPYNELEHAVDRVIRRRDVVVAVKAD
jgi:SAM-dependent methyltransferase